MEAFGEKDTERLMKPAEEVAQEQQAAQQAEGQAGLAERQMKDQTDLRKTQMKTDSARETTIIKALAGRRGNS